MHSPHPGTLDIYEVAPGGATSEDPAIAYDTVSLEPIQNVYEGLATYNGTSNSSYTPVLATCIPETVQCTTDYGTPMVYQADGAPYTGAAGTEPVYWSFAIDPAARFYDSSTHASWGVYPTDVMFSEAREAAWSEDIGVGSTAGWLTAQTLLPNGSELWESGFHAPYNTTPGNILGSMLINDTAYCPASALTNAHGCITFDAFGGGHDWPQFMQWVDDVSTGSVVPCGRFSYESAGIPGWSGSLAAHGDGPCEVSQLGHTHTTSSPAWASYISNLTSPTNTNPTTNMTSWDAFEQLAYEYPAPQPTVQWEMVGSGPYYADLSPSSNPPGYALTANPNYAQPSACSGAGALAKYPGPGCFPTPKGYQPRVQVYYEPTDTVGIGEYRLGHADFAGINPSEYGSMLDLAGQGKLNYYSVASLDVSFFPFNLNWSASAYAAESLPEPAPNIPADFFSGQAARSLLTEAYPYSESLRTAWTVDGVPLLSGTGGPVAKGMESYPGNVSFPFKQDLGGAGVGIPDTNPADVGGAAWWWTQGTNASSPYYDPELAACTPTSPCTFDIAGQLGDPGLSTSIGEYISSIEAITGNAVQPGEYTINFGPTWTGLFCSPIECQLEATPGQGALQVWNLGWYPDNFEPQALLLPLSYPNSTYTYPDAVAQQFALPAYDNAIACGHAAPSDYSNLVYWSHQLELTSECQGVAYFVANFWQQAAVHVASPSERGLDYDLVEQILNALGLYVWSGEANQVTSAAPWIAGSSITMNPVLGAGGDQLWFHVEYATNESAVTFRETGLPVGSSWNVTADSATHANTTMLEGSRSTGAIGFDESNGTISFTVHSPAGYGVAQVTGSRMPTYGSADVSGSTTLTVHFGKQEPVFFNESISGAKWTGLASGTSWGVVLTPNGHGGPPGQTLSGTAGAGSASISVTLTAGAHYKFHVTKPANYADSGGKEGGLTIPSHPFTKWVKFGLFSSTVTFSEHGLPAHSTWSVALSGPITETLTGSTTTLKAYLTNGSYTYLATSGVSTGTGTPPSPIVISARTSVTVHLVFPPGGEPPRLDPPTVAPPPGPPIQGILALRKAPSVPFWKFRTSPS